jgi:D-alanine-D-alanine ligase
LDASKAIGVRHLARVDFIVHGDEASMLEVNAMPGFTPSSLLPKAASAEGLSFGQLVGTLVEMVERDAARRERGLPMMP